MKSYPRHLKTAGDHLRKRRLDLGLLQREVAATLGVRVDTIRNWEVGRNGPAQWQWPAVVAFLGYVPFGTDGSLAEKLKAYRRLHGLSQVRLADLIGVDPSTVWHWECRNSSPSRQHMGRIRTLLSHDGSAVTMW